MKKRVREKIGLTALNIFFIVLCFVTLIPILYALSVSFSGDELTFELGLLVHTQGFHAG